ncbi:MAG: class I SAM-dependent methyltransferase [Dehalococcoidia bacterium]|nr:class I SAM-dependent methyltransferase [Dehalococcoidia bacterium]MYD27319.1 class I SAM-dependent methyltransferase [Dehalococcoidia bacterium]
MTYAFGDTDLAARRLALLAETFAQSSRTFLVEAAHTGLRLAADLGCGPGYSTHLLAGTLEAAHTTGLDNSDSFLDLARPTASETVSFRLHDITTGPFPCGPYDLLFSRFELTHLQRPEAVVELWGRQLEVGGRLLIEEVEYIETPHPVFTAYMEINQAMLTEQGNSLYIGPVLDAILDPPSLKRRASNVQSVPVPADRAAAMFHMNLGVWRHNDFVRRNFAPSDIDDLDGSLAAIASGQTAVGPVEWGLRHIVMERIDP